MESVANANHGASWGGPGVEKEPRGRTGGKPNGALGVVDGVAIACPAGLDVRPCSVELARRSDE
eukprot:6512667-Lingulodinium_polyedra.AAC.1